MCIHIYVTIPIHPDIAGNMALKRLPQGKRPSVEASPFPVRRLVPKDISTQICGVYPKPQLRLLIQKPYLERQVAQNKRPDGFK